MNACRNTMSAHTTLTNWESIDWSKIIEYVKKLRQRIYRAEQLGQHRRVRKLQRLMILSKSNLLLSIRRVTQINKGKRTAGIDGLRISKASERVNLYNEMLGKNVQLHRPKSAKRIYIKKRMEK